MLFYVTVFSSLTGIINSTPSLSYTHTPTQTHKHWACDDDDDDDEVCMYVCMYVHTDFALVPFIFFK